ncbi:hypothetical protein [Bradyrhizobium sp. JYMT SZCCT0428]|uniref:hypothetical protein n=1 Tax=Bradyrhizobium sp. JYMT SZCCT0428 TaxID=2807673 RepID=UPI001BA57712|nr:hypothetical protein [Bradyrhizobium sp. JYMT SZCCT0428]MBR1150086.1 hypothetical protein [Bradyrhizobium sp. JYMT SZCCT0428]
MAARFWVGGTGNLDGSTTTHIAATSNGAGGASYPGSGDTLTFDGNSGGGTVTVTAPVNFTSITMGAFTGTLDFAANDVNVTLQSFSLTGSATRTLNMGDGTWTLTGTGTVWNALTTTGLTFNANGSTLLFSASTLTSRNLTGNLTYNNVTIAANATGGAFLFNTACTIGALNIAGPNNVAVSQATTVAVTTLNVNGSSGSEIFLRSSVDSAAGTLSVAANAPTITWAALRDITCSGGATFVADNSFDLGHNSGITINAPSVGGGGRAIQINNDSLVAA